MRRKENADLSTSLSSGPTARRGRRDDNFVAGGIPRFQEWAAKTADPERSRGICGSADPSWKCFSTERSGGCGKELILILRKHKSVPQHSNYRDLLDEGSAAG